MSACPVDETSFELVFEDEAVIGKGAITIDQEMDLFFIDKSKGIAGLFKVYVNCKTVGGVSGQ
jgi:hypothetical protein